MAALTVEQMLQIAQSVGFRGPALERAVAIAMAESGGVGRQSTFPGEQSYGITQINVPSHPGYDAQRLNADPKYAFQAMYDITNKGDPNSKNWNEWTTWSGATPAGKASDAHGRLPEVQNAMRTMGVSDQGATAPPSSDPNNSDDAALQQAFGFASHLADIPELKNILDQAVAHKWDPSAIEAAVRNSEWARGHRQSQVDWELQQRLHPAEAEAQKSQLKQQIQDQATALGFTLRPDRIDTVAGWILNNGLDKNEADKAIKAEFHYNPSNAAGSTATQADKLKQLAKAYMVPLSDQVIGNWTDAILHGTDTEDSFTQYIKEQAKSMFPTFAGSIDAGHSTTQLFDPYKQVLSTELGVVDPDMTDPKYLGALMQTDPKTGTRTMPTLDQWQTTIRSDPKYGWAKTTRAQNMAADFGEKLLQDMGSV